MSQLPLFNMKHIIVSSASQDDVKQLIKDLQGALKNDVIAKAANLVVTVELAAVEPVEVDDA